MSDLEYEYFFDGKAVATRDIATFIDDDDAGDTLYTWSELPWIHAATGATNPTSYYTSFLGEVVPDAKPEIMEDLRAQPPAYVVISDDTFAPFPELEEFVADGYVVLRAQNDWRLYRRADLDGSLQPQDDG